MGRMMRGCVCLLCLCLAGCVTTNTPAPVADSRSAGRGETVRAPAAGGRTYVVKKGDTLHSIALDHGIDYRDLIVWNGIDNPNRIRVGQSLRVAPPGETAVSASGAEVRPVSNAAPVATRALDERPLPPPSPVAAPVQPVPAATSEDGKLKRSPKGGKLPYSPENLARLKAAETALPAAAPVAVDMPPKAAASDRPAPPAPSPEKSPTALEWQWPTGGKVIAGFSEGGAGETNKGLDIGGRIGDPIVAAAAGKVIHVGNEIRGLGNFVVVKHNADYLSVYGNASRILVKQDQMVTRGQKIAELGNSDADQPKLHFEVRLQGKPVDPLGFLPPR